jgi:hypothetical protein
VTRPVPDPGPCRYCGNPSYMVDDDGHLHGCCKAAAAVNPKGRCPGCGSSLGFWKREERSRNIKLGQQRRKAKKATTSGCRYCNGHFGYGPHEEGACLTGSERRQVAAAEKALADLPALLVSATKDMPTCRYCGRRYSESAAYSGRTPHCGSIRCTAEHEGRPLRPVEHSDEEILAGLEALGGGLVVCRFCNEKREPQDMRPWYAGKQRCSWCDSK